MQEKDEVLLAAFRRKRARQLFAAVPALVVVAFVLVRGKGAGLAVAGWSQESVGAALVSILLLALAFSLRNWRCPSCNRYLGKTINPSFCARCGTQLR